MGPCSDSAVFQCKQLQAASDEVDAVMELSLGKCTQGMAWRKRGFILYEQGKLREAFEAYRKSLEFDPSNKVAMDELRSLASELLRTGKLTAKEKTTYTPPPLQPGSVVGSCTDGD
jgi:tetratricopeptide (TPR) repeat protein